MQFNSADCKQTYKLGSKEYSSGGRRHVKNKNNEDIKKLIP
jgi:hypothetical protein